MKVFVLRVESKGKHASGKVPAFEAKCQKCLNFLFNIPDYVGDAEELLWGQGGVGKHLRQFSTSLGRVEPELVDIYIGMVFLFKCY